MQSDQQAALGYLKEQFGEGWDCALWSEDGIGVDDRWQARAIHGIVEVRTFREPDPMSAARACVEARDAAFPQKPERWYSEQTMAAVAKERDELRTDADRLAEALRTAISDLIVATEVGGGVGQTIVALRSIVAAHDARRKA